MINLQNLNRNHFIKNFVCFSFATLALIGCDINRKNPCGGVPVTQVKKIFKDFSPSFPEGTKFLFLNSIKGLTSDIYVLKGKTKKENLTKIYKSFGFVNNDFSTHENYCKNWDISPCWDPERLAGFKSALHVSNRGFDNALLTISFTFENDSNKFATFYVQCKTIYN